VLSEEELKPTIYHTRGEHANHYTTDEHANHYTTDEHANHYTTDAVILDILDLLAITL
jgi:hypothetical protein